MPSSARWLGSHLLLVLLTLVPLCSAQFYGFPGSYNNFSADAISNGTRCSPTTSNGNIWFRVFTGTPGSSTAFKVALNGVIAGTSWGTTANISAPTGNALFTYSFTGNPTAGSPDVSFVFPSSGNVTVWFNADNKQIGFSDLPVCVDATSTIVCTAYELAGLRSVCTVTPRVAGVQVRNFAALFTTPSLNVPTTTASITRISPDLNATSSLQFSVSSIGTASVPGVVSVVATIASPSLSVSFTRYDAYAFPGQWNGNVAADEYAIGFQCTSSFGGANTNIWYYDFKNSPGTTNNFKVVLNGAYSTSWGAPNTNTVALDTFVAGNTVGGSPDLRFVYPASGQVFAWFNTLTNQLGVSSNPVCVDGTSTVTCPSTNLTGSAVRCTLATRFSNADVIASPWLLSAPTLTPSGAATVTGFLPNLSPASRFNFTVSSIGTAVRAGVTIVTVSSTAPPFSVDFTRSDIYSFPGQWNSFVASDPQAYGLQCDSATSNGQIWYRRFTGTFNTSTNFKVVRVDDISFKCLTYQL